MAADGLRSTAQTQNDVARPARGPQPGAAALAVRGGKFVPAAQAMSAQLNVQAIKATWLAGNAALHTVTR